MGRKPPRQPVLDVDTIVVELPVFNEAELRDLGQSCLEVLKAVHVLNRKVRKVLQTVEATLAQYEGRPSEAKPEPRLKVHSGGKGSGDPGKPR